MSRNIDVIIVGGGMGGMILALDLARRGRSAAIVERQTQFQSIVRGELLQPNGLRILDHLGLLEPLQALPHQRARFFHFHRIGRGRLCIVDYETLPPPWNYAVITLPHHLLNLLLRQIEKSERIQMFSGFEFRNLLERHGRAAGVRARGEGGDLDLRAPVVVGSDGARSPVRQALGLRARVHEYSEGYLTLVVPLPAGWGREIHYYVGRSEILGLFPVSDKELYLFYMISRADQGRLREGPLSDFTGAVCRIDPRLSDSIRSVSSWDQVGYMPCFRVRAERWTADGAALIGDAAHAMNPHVAQGRNQAMEDAATLAGVIDQGLADGDCSRAVLSRYEARRRPTVERLQRISDELTFLWNTGFGPLAWFRDRIFTGMAGHDDVRFKVLKTISGLDVKPLGWLDRFKVFLP